jgi:tRNA nucleotidyltransferase (CCA-adding enzyme)
MAKRAHAYPQVDPGAGGLVETGVARVAVGAGVAQALAAARRRDAGVVGAGERWVLRADLSRAAGLGLETLPATALARPLPVVDAEISEITVRRLLAMGAPAVVVRDRRGPVGAVTGIAGAAAPLGQRFAQRLDDAGRAVLAAASPLAAERGARAFVAGGTVRDALAGGPATGRDLDLVVEGDGPGFARALAAAFAGGAERALVEHARFLTASVALPDGRRVDVATARTERYEAPGALPRVMPATISQDLARRDFTINAMAVDLGSGDFELLDPHGGRRDLARRRLRVLHPLSFVEDPTRIFRAARYGARLGFVPDSWTVRAQALALRLAPYPALSGQRLAAELELILADVRPEMALARLGAAGAFRLLDPRYRFRRATAARLRGLGAALAWSRQRGLGVAPLELGALALVADQAPAIARAALGRLGLSGQPLADLERARGRADALTRRIAAARTPSARARPLWDCPNVELAWLWLVGAGPVRAAIEWFTGRARDVRPALGGDDLAARGVPRGPAIAEVLTALRDARLDGLLGDRDAEAAYVQHWVGGTTAPPSAAGAAQGPPRPRGKE